MIEDNSKNSKNIIYGIIAVVIIVVVIAVVAVSMNNKKDSDDKSKSAEVTTTAMKNSTESKDIIDNAVNTSSVSTLVTAVKAADLVSTLKGEGPFTVFAPTNDAFNKLPAGTVDTLLKTENKKTLTDILTYHVIAGKYKASDLTNGMKLKTVNGEELFITKKDNVVYVNGVKVETPDVMSSNGVIFIIPEVLIPSVSVGGTAVKPSLDIVDNAVNVSNLSTLVTAVKAAELVNTLKGEGPFTVFAPTNDAFNKLPEGTVTNLLKPENKSQLAKILTYHVVSGRYKSTDLMDGQTLTTVQGETITVKISGGKVMLMAKNSTSTVQLVDLVTSNGVVHVIDTVLLP